MREKLAMCEKINRGMSLELEKLKLLLKSKEGNYIKLNFIMFTETEHDLAVSKEEIEALQERAALLSIELLEYKEKNSKLMKDYEGITDSILVLQ